MVKSGRRSGTPVAGAYKSNKRRKTVKELREVSANTGISLPASRTRRAVPVAPAVPATSGPCPRPGSGPHAAETAARAAAVTG
ncbi:hypothetical protein GCM10010515_23770 [Streptomyces fructofermentans]|uniref:Uncharacterized protein n=1 Tax=Streptomyces fructofermentans TaxID=152141 RepID=A0A918KBH5_9ACTN|nr:hypothetical protein GCM10010515_23770 [Streptomyces fructofermentans]